MAHICRFCLLKTRHYAVEFPVKGFDACEGAKVCKMFLILKIGEELQELKIHKNFKKLSSKVKKILASVEKFLRNIWTNCPNLR